MTQAVRPTHALAFGLLSLFLLAETATAEDLNRTGQSQKESGSAPANSANPAENNGPLLPGDQPQKEGMAPSSQVHNLDKNDLSGKKNSELRTN